MSAPPAAAVKETKAQKSERLKLAKNPWDARTKVQPVREGRSRCSAAGVGRNLFKWWVIYTQGDGVGATGGIGGEGKATEFFMMRIGLPNGILTSAQLRVIGELTKKYARNLADITTRQNIQLHWLTIEALPEIVDALTAVGLSPKGACGDVVGDLTGCPLAGLDGHEIIDASPLAVEIAHKLTANPDTICRGSSDRLSRPGLWSACVGDWKAPPKYPNGALLGLCMGTSEADQPSGAMLACGQRAKMRSHVAQVAAGRESHPFLDGRILQSVFAVIGVIETAHGLAIILDELTGIKLGIDHHGVRRGVDFFNTHACFRQLTPHGIGINIERGKCRTRLLSPLSGKYYAKNIRPGVRDHPRSQDFPPQGE